MKAKIIKNEQVSPNVPGIFPKKKSDKSPYGFTSES